MEKFLQNKVALWVIALIIFIIWFFSWQEYLKYQMRSALSEVSKWLNNLWKNISWDINTNIENKKEETKKEAENIKFGENFSFKKSEWEELALKVREVKDLWKSYEDVLYWKQEAKNNFFIVRLEAENIWKKETFKSLSEYDIKIFTVDWFEYKAKTVKQVTENRPEGYEWCISCSHNPWEKNIQDIIFDIPSEKIKWAKIMLDEEDNVLFSID